VACFLGLQDFGRGWNVYVFTIISFNDAAAYFVGSAIGKTPLIKLSPNKTLEGYLGGACVTVLLTAWLTQALFDKPYMVCPLERISFSPFYNEPCDIPQVYLKQTYTLPPLLGSFQLSASPAQFYATGLGIFCAFVAPFGGFFASGVKRAYNIKDFSNLLPGHGGFIDRFDCTCLLGIIAYVFLYNEVMKDY
jgi:phosphatidate cytidylyltransferase